VAALLGVRCERINCSASTTLQQLLGGVMPRMQGGARVFSWQDGKLLRALREGSWLLLDELNLAPPEVLDGLASLFDRWVYDG
jgi:midasin (ATPase involved in ribosome maturation)